MGSIQQIKIKELNSFLEEQDYKLVQIEFERGLGIVDDAFYFTIESESNTVIIKIITNLRCKKNGVVILRYHDLFLSSEGKQLSKRVYQSQKLIELTMLNRELELFNEHYHCERIKKIVFSRNGDLQIRIEKNGLIEAIDDLDISKNGRLLYSVLLIKKISNDLVLFNVSEKNKGIVVETTKDCEIYQQKFQRGIRFFSK